MKISPGRWALGVGAVAMSTGLLVPVASSASAATIQPAQPKTSQAACEFTTITGTQGENAVALEATNGDVFVLEVQNQFGNVSPAPFGNTDLWERPVRLGFFIQALNQPTSLAGANTGRLQTIPALDGIFYAEIIPQTTLAGGDPISVRYNTCTYIAEAFGPLPFGSTP